MMENATSFNTTSELCSTCPLSFWVILMLVLGTLNWVLTLPTGLWAVWLLTHRSRASVENEFFMLNLYCTDQASVLISLVTCFIVLASPSDQLNPVLSFLYKVSLYSQPLFQCCVCVEYYLAVVCPIVFLKLRSRRYKEACLVLLWLVSLVSHLMERFLSSSLPLIVVLLAVVHMQLFCNLSVLAVLRRPGPGDNQGGAEGEREQGSGIKKRAFLIISLLQVKLLLNYMPLFVATSIKQHISNPVLKRNLLIAATNMCFLGTFIQPVLYLRKVGKL